MELRAPGTAEVLASAAFSDAYYAAGGAFVSSDGNWAISLDHDRPAAVRYSLGFDRDQGRVSWPDYDEGDPTTGYVVLPIAAILGR